MSHFEPLAPFETIDHIHGDKRFNVIRFDVSAQDTQDLFLWTCSCGQQTLTSAAGGQLVDCGCPEPHMTVTVINHSPPVPWGDAESPR